MTDYRDEEERAADCRTRWLNEEHFHALEEEEYERERAIDEAFLASLAEDYDDDVVVPV